MNNKLTVLNYVALSISLLFSLLQLHFVADISLLAGVISLIFTIFLAWVSLVLVQKNTSLLGLKALSKMYEYLPFVFLITFVLRRAGESNTSHLYDVVTVFLWVAVLVCVFLLRYQLHPKRVFTLNPAFERIALAQGEAKISKLFKFLKECISWIDAIVWAIFTVALINVFVFQLYEIPSESMVPEFLVRDRVVVVKLADGPTFPLSKVGIPRLRDYDRGDIVVFRNPHYKQDKHSELKDFASQLVYMFTLMQVNINVDENGNPKADPLVKRVCGLPGEQLVMMDGVLYKRNSSMKNFEIVKDDSLWAEWNLAGLPYPTREKVQSIRFSKGEYDTLLELEQARRTFDLRAASQQCSLIAKEFSNIVGNSQGNQAALRNFYSGSDLYIYTMFNTFDSIARRLMSVEGGNLWFSEFMTSWIDSVYIGGEEATFSDVYSKGMLTLDVMAKRIFGELVLEYAKAIKNDTSVAFFSRNDIRKLLERAQHIVSYVVSVNDLRNMPVFPQNDEEGAARYIPDYSYFMMGDNRFNSLDMRHSYSYKMIALSTIDPYSFRYNSNMNPQAVPDTRILGSPVLRIFPFSRFGVPGITAEKSK